MPDIQPLWLTLGDSKAAVEAFEVQSAWAARCWQAASAYPMVGLPLQPLPLTGPLPFISVFPVEDRPK